jgi:hypothetical protein
MAPPAPSHANSRAWRAPATASSGGRMGGIGGTPKHGGRGSKPQPLGGVQHSHQRKGPGESKRWQGRSASAGPLWPTAATGMAGAHRSQSRWRQGCWGQVGYREEEGEVGGVGRFDRSNDRADQVWLDQRTDQAGMGRLGQLGFGLFSQLDLSLLALYKKNHLLDSRISRKG